MDIKIEYKINELQELCTLVKEASTRKKGDPIHLIENKHKFTLSEEEVNQKFYTLYTFYQNVYDETIDVLRDYEDLIPYMNMPSSSEESCFVESAIRNINCKSIEDLDLKDLLYGCNYELSNMDKTEEGFTQTEEEELNQQIAHLKTMGSNYNEIFVAVNKTDLHANDKILLLNWYQNISSIYPRFIQLLNSCHKIYNSNIDGIEFMVNKTIEQFCNEDGTISRLEDFEIAKYIDFNEWTYRRDETIYLSCSIMNPSSMGITISMDKKVPITLVVGVLFQELNNLINKEVSKELLFLEQLKAIGDASRLKIMKLLSIKPVYIKEIANETGLTSATVSHHMGILLKAKLVLLYNEGRKTYYRVNKKEMNQLSHIITELSGEKE